jgi:hypothetical protein
MPYKTFATNDVLTAADMNAVTADAQTQDVATSQTTTSLSYTDLATSGPAATISLVSGQGVLVFISARASNSLGGTSGQAFFSYAATGAVSQSAADANGVEADVDKGITSTRITWVTASSTASATFTMKYRAGTAGTAVFADRRIIVKKF